MISDFDPDEKCITSWPGGNPFHTEKFTMISWLRGKSGGAPEETEIV